MERLNFVVWVLAFWLWSILLFGFVSKVSANAEGACSDVFSKFSMHFLFLQFGCVSNMELLFAFAR
jgi:hypothetical protein